MDIFDENGKYTSKAAQLDGVVRMTLDPIFKEWKKIGYSFRDISHVTMLAVTMLESEAILTEAIKNRKRKQNV